MNTSDFLLENGAPDRIAIVEASSSCSYAELKAAAGRMASILLGKGLGPGDRVAILGPNSLFWVASYLAIMKLGMVAVPLSTMLSVDDARRETDWAGCKAVLMDHRQGRIFGGAFGPEILTIRDDDIDASGQSIWPAPEPDFDLGADAVLMFTSGTTSRPKAVRVTHRNLQANTASIVEYLGLGPSDRMLVILPFFYCFGASLLHTHLRVGGGVALCNSFTYPETALDLLEKTGCTGFAGVPSSFQLLLRISTFKTRPLPSLRLIQQAGGKLHKVLIEELVSSKPSAKVFIMYGATEATARLSYLPPEKIREKMGSIGKGIPGVRLRVLRDDGSPVVPGETGEIVAYGENISPGYYRDPELSAEKFAGNALHTGDLATVDEEGYIYVVDRKEDFIKSWGYRISSQEVESCVLEMGDVVSAAAIGVPSLEAGEEIQVFAVLRPGAATTEEDIIAHCRSRIARHMVPRSIVFIDAIPLNSNGKVVKSELRKRAAG